MPSIMVGSAPPASLTAKEFGGWLRDAAPGAVLPYHRGLLAFDVEAGAEGRSAEARQALLALARLARQACEQGLVHLVQKRSEPGPFTYLAVRRPAQPLRPTIVPPAQNDAARLEAIAFGLVEAGA